MENKGEILIYQAEDGTSQLEVRLEEETIWMNLNQITSLFGRDKSVISRHIKNIFIEGELIKEAVVAFFATTGTDNKKYNVEYFNLDMILSIGYRVNSKRGTQFRIWATKTLNDHIVKGYSINEKRLQQENAKKLYQLQQTLEFIQASINNKQLSSNETSGLLQVITDYTRTFILLNQYDTEALKTTHLHKEITYEIQYEEAAAAIEQLKKKLILLKEATDLFGKQKDESFKGILQNIVQTFDGDYLYPTIEEQAAHLLYFIIKNHPFVDGNKRTGAFLFIWFLQRNKHLLRQNGEAKINDNALVALALLVAQSDPIQKEIMIKLIINLINK